jgi:hypothetical protein
MALQVVCGPNIGSNGVKIIPTCQLSQSYDTIKREREREKKKERKKWSRSRKI